MKKAPDIFLYVKALCPFFHISSSMAMTPKNESLLLFRISSYLGVPKYYSLDLEFPPPSPVFYVTSLTQQQQIIMSLMSAILVLLKSFPGNTMLEPTGHEIAPESPKKGKTGAGIESRIAC